MSKHKPNSWREIEWSKWRDGCHLGNEHTAQVYKLLRYENPRERFVFVGVGQGLKGPGCLNVSRWQRIGKRATFNEAKTVAHKHYRRERAERRREQRELERVDNATANEVLS